MKVLVIIRPVLSVAPKAAVRVRPWMLHAALAMSCCEVLALAWHPFQLALGETTGHAFAVVAAFLAHAADHLPKHLPTQE